MEGNKRNKELSKRIKVESRKSDNKNWQTDNTFVLREFRRKTYNMNARLIKLPKQMCTDV